MLHNPDWLVIANSTQTGPSLKQHLEQNLLTPHKDVKKYRVKNKIKEVANRFS